MSLGNLRTYGNKGSNFNYQLRSLRLLGQIKNLLAAGQTIIVDGVSSDQLLATVPAGYMLELIVAQPVGGVAVITMDYGTTNGGSELIAGETITPPNPTTTQLNYIAGGNTAFDVYASSPAWGLGTVTFYLILRKIS